VCKPVDAQHVGIEMRAGAGYCVCDWAAMGNITHAASPVQDVLNCRHLFAFIGTKESRSSSSALPDPDFKTSDLPAECVVGMTMAQSCTAAEPHNWKRIPEVEVWMLVG
jgi:hypothetical protein